jgi:hypothetical protein
VFSYDLVPAGGVQTRVSPNSAVTIQIPNGKRLRLLDGSYPLDFSITNASNVSANFKVANNPESAMGQAVSARELELSGPLTVEVNSNEAMNWGLYVTYYFVEDVAQAAGPSVQAPAGSLVTVEKSTDLQAWQPAFITPETSAPKAFYRLKVVK